MKDPVKIALAIVIVIAAYIILHKIFGKSKGDKVYIAEAENPNSPFNISYWRNFYYQGGSPANGRKPITQAMINRLTDAGDNCYNAFGYLSDDEARFYAGLKKCQSKAEVSYMAYIISTKHNTGLLERMKSGAGIMPENGFNDTEMQTAVNYVKNLKTV